MTTRIVILKPDVSLTEATVSIQKGMAVKDWRNCDAIERRPDRVSGAWIFRGTRVPVAALFENLKDGASIEQFLEWFPGVERSQVEAVLNYEMMALTDSALV
jgi:uncharacterized protein (DUF433 family)